MVVASDGPAHVRVGAVAESQFVGATRAVEIRVGAFRHDGRRTVSVERLASSVVIRVVLQRTESCDTVGSRYNMMLPKDQK